MPSTLITGANRGIGLEFARQYLDDGWQVYAACRNPNSASELRRLADTSDHKLRIMALDVTDPASVKAAAAELDGQAIDLLLNNAGVGGVRGQTIGNIDYEAWANVLDANTMGPMRVSEAFVDHVARSERKLIVTLTSGMGSLADNTSGGSIAYRSSKAAVNMVMRSLAIDLAPHGITIWITAQAATRLRNMSSLLKGCSARLQARVIIAPHRHSRKIQWPTGFSICLCYGWP
jgi:NAD(P)-dependent dehydrogenase (short-subunit alcohol dehydrogenase family)